jgi:hypothetical protein
VLPYADQYNDQEYDYPKWDKGVKVVGGNGSFEREVFWVIGPRVTLPEIRDDLRELGNHRGQEGDGDPGEEAARKDAGGVGGEIHAPTLPVWKISSTGTARRRGALGRWWIDGEPRNQYAVNG